jgi:hypothetical protein
MVHVIHVSALRRSENLLVDQAYVQADEAARDEPSGKLELPAGSPATTGSNGVEDK